MRFPSSLLLSKKQVYVHIISRLPARLCPPRQWHYGLTDQWTNGPTDGHTLIKNRCVATKNTVFEEEGGSVGASRYGERRGKPARFS